MARARQDAVVALVLESVLDIACPRPQHASTGIEEFMRIGCELLTLPAGAERCGVWLRQA